MHSHGGDVHNIQLYISFRGKQSKTRAISLTKPFVTHRCFSMWLGTYKPSRHVFAKLTRTNYLQFDDVTKHFIMRICAIVKVSSSFLLQLTDNC